MALSGPGPRKPMQRAGPGPRKPMQRKASETVPRREAGRAPQPSMLQLRWCFGLSMHCPVGDSAQLVSGGPRVVSASAKNRLTLRLERYRAKTTAESEQGPRREHSCTGKCGDMPGEMPRLATG